MSIYPLPASIISSEERADGTWRCELRNVVVDELKSRVGCYLDVWDVPCRLVSVEWPETDEPHFMVLADGPGLITPDRARLWLRLLCAIDEPGHDWPYEQEDKLRDAVLKAIAAGSADAVELASVALRTCGLGLRPWLGCGEAAQSPA